MEYPVDEATMDIELNHFQSLLPSDCIISRLEVVSKTAVNASNDVNYLDLATHLQRVSNLNFEISLSELTGVILFDLYPNDKLDIAVEVEITIACPEPPVLKIIDLGVIQDSYKVYKMEKRGFLIEGLATNLGLTCPIDRLNITYPNPSKNVVLLPVEDSKLLCTQYTMNTDLLLNQTVLLEAHSGKAVYERSISFEVAPRYARPTIPSFEKKHFMNYGT
jgi:hypothetical protein